MTLNLNKSMQSTGTKYVSVLCLFLGKIKFYILLIGLAVFIRQSTQAQFNNNWAFGIEQGLNFNGDSIKLIKTAINDTADYKYKPGYSSTISDCNGNLLFYSNGNVVLNKNHKQMLNGRLITSGRNNADISTNCLIIPIPLSGTLYYFIYSNIQYGGIHPEDSTGLFFALIDMNGDGGLGEVLFKDSLLNSIKYPSTNLAWAKHINDTAIWLIAPTSETSISAFLIDGNGFDMNAIKSAVLTQTFDNFATEKEKRQVGYIKMANGFNKMLCVNIQEYQTSLGTIVEYDFDNKTGKFSNPKAILKHHDYDGGLILRNAQYSPNDSLVYAIFDNWFNYTEYNALELYRLTQIDKHTLKQTIAFSLNRYNLPAQIKSLNWGIQKTPKGEMVACLASSLYRIKHPNKLGTQADVIYIDTLLQEKRRSLNNVSVYLRIWDLPNTYNTDKPLYFNRDLNNGVCQDTATFNYYGDTTFYKLVWYFGDGDSTVFLPPNIKKNMQVKHRYLKDGTYAVSLKSFHATCDRKQQYADNIAITIAPKINLATLTDSKACYADTLQYNFNLTYTDSIQHFWGDGLQETNVAADTFYNSQHIYFKEQQYPLKTIAKSNNGCQTIINDSFKSIFNPKPIQKIVVNTIGLTAQSIQFNNTALFQGCEPFALSAADTTYNLAVFTLKWNNGLDSQKVMAGEATLSLSFEGNTQPKLFGLTSVNQFGCTTTDSFYTQTYARPKVNATLVKDSACLRSNSFVLNKNTQYQGNADSLSSSTIWEQGGSKDTQNTHNYAATGQKNIMHIATGEFRCADTAQIIANVVAHPKAALSLSALSACFNNHEITINALNPNGNNEQVFWGDNTQEALINNASHQYALYGNYEIALVSANDFGCTDTAKQVIVLWQNPKASLSLSDSILCGNAGALTINSTIIAPFSTNIQRLTDDEGWISNFTGAFNMVEKNYSNAGNHFINLYVKDINGCEDSARASFRVLEKPEYSFSQINEVCLGQETEIGFAIVQAGNYQYQWTLDNQLFTENGNQQLNTQYTFKQAGSKPIALQFTDEFECIYLADTIAMVHSLPKADFAYQRTDYNPPYLYFAMQNKSSFANNYTWFAEKGGYYQTENPVIQFTDTGMLHVNLIATNDKGCSDTVDKILAVFPEIKFVFPNAITANADGLNDDFGTASARFIKTYKMEVYSRWGEKVFSSNNPNDRWKPETEGVYVYAVYITDIFDKVINLDGTVTVLR